MTANKTHKYVEALASDIEEMYGKDNLAEFPMFAGGYINFGLWRDISYAEHILSEEDKTKSSEDLYRYLFEASSIKHDSEVLEVGCGQGLGCRMLQETKQPRKIIGLDRTKEQAERSLRNNSHGLKESSHVNFVTGNAESMPFPDSSFTHLVSVEAAQHFSSMDRFFSEAYRVLIQDGELIITTFFPTSVKSASKLRRLIPNFDVIMNDYPIDEIETSLVNNGFQDIKIHSIGEHVWHGFDTWLSQGELKNQWSRIWLKAYEEKLVDYYVIKAIK